MNKYLHFCRRENLATILESQTIDRELSRSKELDYSRNHDDAKQVNFVYDIQKIRSTECYVTYPFSYIDNSIELEVEKKFLWFRWRAKKRIRLKLHESFAAVIFESNQKMTDQFMVPTLMTHPLFNKPIYCESYCDSPIIANHVKEIDYYEALNIIGIEDEFQPSYMYLYGLVSRSTGKKHYGIATMELWHTYRDSLDAEKKKIFGGQIKTLRIFLRVFSD